MRKLLFVLLCLTLSYNVDAQRLWRTPASQEWRDSLEVWGNERWAPISGGGVAWGGITGTISLQSDLMALFGAKMDTSAIGFHFRAAINAGNAPSLANPFATMADLGGSETDPVFTTWLGTNDYLSSSTTSTQDGYFRRIYLKDAVNPSHYLGIINEDDLTASRTLNINLGDASRTLTLAGNATISGTNTGDQVEADPVFAASAAAGIAGGDITNWNTAFGWGNHAGSGYLTAATTKYKVIAKSGATIASVNSASEQIYVSILIPAGTLGNNDEIRVPALFNSAAGAGNKIYRIRLHTSAAIGGTVYQQLTIGSGGGSYKALAQIQMKNATNSQEGFGQLNQAYGSGNVVITSSLSTASDMYIVITVQKATGTDDAELRNYTVEIVTP